MGAGIVRKEKLNSLQQSKYKIENFVHCSERYAKFSTAKSNIIGGAKTKKENNEETLI